MNAFLTRLCILPEVQGFFTPHYYTNTAGNLCFSYGNEPEVYGLGFHRVPLTGCWLAGPENLALVRHVFICSSAMEAIAWLNCNLPMFRTTDHLLFIATGSKLEESRFARLRMYLTVRKYFLIFGNDPLGCICDLKAAALLAGYPIEITVAGNDLGINFRNRHFTTACENFSLHSFERLSGYRFKVKTCKPGNHISWLAQLQAQSYQS